MQNDKIEAISKPYKDIFKTISEKHIIPALQRPYVWIDKKQVKKFLDDINENENYYFIGSLVFIRSQKGTTGREEVIDGQQRLITISLILLAIRDLISEYDKSDQLENILREINSFLRYIDAYDHQEVIRLTFTDNMTGYYFKKMLTNEPEEPKTETQKRLSDNYLYIKKDLKNIFINNDEFDESAAEKYFEKIKSLWVIGITCSDSTTAYELFESINATAAPLASVDLIKNSVFKYSKQDKKLLNNIEVKWHEIEDLFCDSRSLLKTYLRHQWISNGQYVSHSGLYSAVEDAYKRKNPDVGIYITELLNDARVYLSLRNANIDDLALFNGSKRNDLFQIKELLQFLIFLDVDQVYAPILYLYKKSNKDNFKKYLIRLVSFQFLYKFIPGSPSTAEKIFADISKFGEKKIDHNLQMLTKLVSRSKDVFEENFLQKTIYRGSQNGDIQFILERYIFSKGEPWSFKEPTIEHMISQKLSDEKIIQTIGNLTIFEKSVNSKLPDKFKDKVQFYTASPYPEHKEIVSKYWFDKNYTKSINARGKDIAKDVYDIFMKMLQTGKYR
jgi:hypothetical protein